MVFSWGIFLGWLANVMKAIVKLFDCGTSTDNKSEIEGGQGNSIRQDYRDSHNEVHNHISNSIVITNNYNDSMPASKIKSNHEASPSETPLMEGRLNEPVKTNNINESDKLCESQKKNSITVPPETQEKLDFLKNTICK